MPLCLLRLLLQRTMACGNAEGVPCSLRCPACHPQERSASWRARRAGCSTTIAPWRRAQPMPLLTTTSVGCWVPATTGTHSLPCAALLPCTCNTPSAAAPGLKRYLAVWLSHPAAGVAAGEAGKAGKAIEHYGTAVSGAMRCARGAMPAGGCSASIDCDPSLHRLAATRAIPGGQPADQCHMPAVLRHVHTCTCSLPCAGQAHAAVC